MKLLITGAFSISQKQIDFIENMGHKVIFMQNEADLLPCLYDEVEGVICNGLFLHHPIEKFSHLKYIQLTSAGFDRVPMEYITEKGIEIHSARGVYSIPMAEYALYGVLSLYKNGRFFMENQKKRQWEKNRSLIELYGKTVCIVGCGSVGNECAKRFSAFGCSVIGVDVLPRQDEMYAEILPLTKLYDVLEKADITVLTLPLTDKTKNIIDSKAFSSMKDGAVIVNIARGGVVDTKALIKALNTKLGGAVLDVFQEEPLDTSSELWNMENVIITPHNSFVGEGNNKRLFDLIIKNLTKEA